MTHQHGVSKKAYQHQRRISSAAAINIIIGVKYQHGSMAMAIVASAEKRRNGEIISGWHQAQRLAAISQRMAA